MAKEKKSVYDVVTETIIAMLEAGKIPWKQPWSTLGPQMPLLYNRPYKGINAFLLAFSEFTSPYWITFNKMKEMGGNLKEGEGKKYRIVTLTLPPEDKKNPEVKARLAKGEKVRTWWSFRYYMVYNTEQCENLNHKKLTELAEKIEKIDNAGTIQIPSIDLAEQILANMKEKPVIEHHGTEAYYSPKKDKIVLPPKGLFDSPEDYYKTLFHEIGHWTGHESRLDREGIKKVDFGTERYSKEELIAEMTAAFLCANCGIENRMEESAGYIQGWLSKLRSDSKLVVQAASAAQKAADLIMGNFIESEESEDAA